MGFLRSIAKTAGGLAEGAVDSLKVIAASADAHLKVTAGQVFVQATSAYKAVVAELPRLRNDPVGEIKRLGAASIQDAKEGIAATVTRRPAAKAVRRVAGIHMPAAAGTAVASSAKAPQALPARKPREAAHPPAAPPQATPRPKAADHAPIPCAGPAKPAATAAARTGEGSGMLSQLRTALTTPTALERKFKPDLDRFMETTGVPLVKAYGPLVLLIGTGIGPELAAARYALTASLRGSAGGLRVLGAMDKLLSSGGSSMGAGAGLSMSQRMNTPREQSTEEAAAIRHTQQLEKMAQQGAQQEQRAIRATQAREQAASGAQNTKVTHAGANGSTTTTAVLEKPKEHSVPFPIERNTAAYNKGLAEHHHAQKSIDRRGDISKTLKERLDQTSDFWKKRAALSGKLAKREPASKEELAFRKAEKDLIATQKKLDKLIGED